MCIRDSFEALYGPICHDMGLAPTGTAKHKAEVLAMIHAPTCLGKRHDKVAKNRWFSWVGAAYTHDASWHAVLLCVLTVGIKQKAFKSFQDTPLFCSAPWRCPAPPEDPSGDEEEKAGAAAAKQARKVVAAASGPGSSTDPPPRDDTKIP
eukprot:9171440-Lingulodinium_polyedra.AAC.1